MECKACNKQLEQVKGKRQRVYCDDTCRMSWNRRKESAQEGMERMGFSKSEQSNSEQPKANTEQVLTPAMLDSLPQGVVRPTGQPSTGFIPRVDWQGGRAYAQVIYNLLTMTIEELREAGQSIPTWRLNLTEVMA